MRKTTFSKIILILIGLFIAQTTLATVALVDTPPAFVPSLKLGSQGDAVKVLQLQLSKIPNIYPEGLISGYFGTLTAKAVRKLQAQNNLEQVGFVGPRTRELLSRISKERINNLGNNLGNSSNISEEMNSPKVTPQVFVIESTSNSASTGYVFWTTSKNTTSDFYYSNITPLASTTPIKIKDNNLSFTHSVNINGLSTSTKYYFVIVSIYFINSV